MTLEQDLDIFIYPKYDKKTLKSSKRYIPDSFAVESASKRLQCELPLADVILVALVKGELDVICLATGQESFNIDSLRQIPMCQTMLDSYATMASMKVNRYLTQIGYYDSLKDIYPAADVDRQVAAKFPACPPGTFPGLMNVQTNVTPEMEEYFQACYAVVLGRPQQKCRFEYNDLFKEKKNFRKKLVSVLGSSKFTAAPSAMAGVFEVYNSIAHT